jgi:hypothetical protein
MLYLAKKKLVIFKYKNSIVIANNNNIIAIVNNNNSIANCMVYLAKKNVINLKMAHNYSRNMSLKGTM